MTGIPKEQFAQRIGHIRREMERQGVQVCLVFGDEYRKEYLRYVSNYWPLFERGALVIPLKQPPILLCAPECEKYAAEMSVWPEIRVQNDLAAVTVPEEIDYARSDYVRWRGICAEAAGGKLEKAAIVGLDIIPQRLYDKLRAELCGVELVDFNTVLDRLRMYKSTEEIACLAKASEIAGLGFAAMMEKTKPGMTELELAAIAEGTALKHGAEGIAFINLGSGSRCALVIPRPTERVVQDGEVVNASLAVQYQGYVATAGFPYAVGQADEGFKRLVRLLAETEEILVEGLVSGAQAGELVRKARGFLAHRNALQYAVYTPLHGIGCAEAESPYPGEQSTLVLSRGIAVNTDVHLFGHPWGSARIEEGFVITEDGHLPLSPFVRALCKAAGV